jgi:hypothetical protein
MFRATFLPAPRPAKTGVVQAGLLLDATLSDFRWLIVDQTGKGPSLGAFKAEVEGIGEEARLQWLTRALDLHIDDALAITIDLAQRQNDWLDRLHRFTLVAAAARWPERDIRHLLLAGAATWTGSWTDLLTDAQTASSPSSKKQP